MTARVGLSLGLAAALFCAAPAIAAEPITKPETRSLPDQTVRNRILAQLRDILIPMPRPAPHKPAEMPLRDLWYWTVPTPTFETGVCRTNLVVFEFEPVDRRDHGADTPVRMTGLSAEPRYRMLEPGEVCEKLSPVDKDFVAADDEQAFVDGRAAFEALQAAFRSNASFELDCNRLGRPPPKDCRTPVLAAKIGDVGSYSRCDPHPSGHRGTCRQFGFGNYEVRVYSAFENPGALQAATVEEKLMLWHERRD